MKSRAFALAVSMVLGAALGLCAGYLMFGGLRDAPVARTSRPTTTETAASGRATEVGPDVGRLTAAVEKLAGEIASIRSIAEAAAAERDKGTTAGSVSRDLSSPTPPPEHVEELDSAADATSRRKWLLVGEESILAYFGIPSRIWMSQGVGAEYWDYDLGEGRLRTLVIHRGRLIDIR